MENCKYCHQELDEGSSVCPHCGKDNAEQETPVTEAVEQTAPETTEEAVTEVTAPAETVKKATPGKIALAVGAVVVLLAVLIALIMAGVNSAKSDKAPLDPTAATEETVPATIPEDGNPDDATCKGSYTVTDEEAVAAKDTVVATINGHELTNGQLQVHYWSTVNSFLTSEQGYYVMMYGGIDPQKPLDTQRCLLDETMTWQQYFLAQALTGWQTSFTLAAEAEKAGMEMPQEAKDFLDGIETYLETTAGNFGMDVEELLMRNVGSGAGVAEFKAFQEIYSKGGGYYTARVEALVPTEQELEAYFDDHADGYAQSGVTKDGKFVDVRHILVTVEEEETGETGETAATEDVWAKGEAEAQAILDTWLAGNRTEEDFAVLANEKSQDPGSNTNGGLYEKVYEGQMVKPFEEWCFDESRKHGDTGLVKTDYGYHVMYFVGSAPQWKYYAESDWRNEQIGQMLAELAEGYPMEVTYGSIVLGNLKTGE